MGIVLPELRFYPRRFLAILDFRFSVIDRAAKLINELSRRECMGSGHHEASGGVREASGPDAE
jgi:hypothetical protein